MVIINLFTHISHSSDTGTIEEHAGALVALLESCLLHDLKPSNKDEDPPHAKIASDVVSCIFLVRLLLLASNFNTKFYIFRITARNQ